MLFCVQHFSSHLAFVVKESTASFLTGKCDSFVHCTIGRSLSLELASTIHARVSLQLLLQRSYGTVQVEAVEISVMAYSMLRVVSTFFYANANVSQPRLSKLPRASIAQRTGDFYADRRDATPGTRWSDRRSNHHHAAGKCLLEHTHIPQP